MSLPLIQTKLDRPALRPGCIRRPELNLRFDGGLQGRVTLISAPAGYGKSTAVQDWLTHRSDVPSAWLYLDRQDSDLERFVRYVVAALRTVEPGCLSHTESLLSAQTLPPPEFLAENLAAELGERDERTILVLDDYGEIKGEAVHGLIRSLVNRLPDTLHLMLLTRIDPPLSVSLWRSRGWLSEVRALDLRFSREETGRLFHSSGAEGLSDETIEILHEKTEGWVAGLRLAQLSLAGAAETEGQVIAFSGSDRIIVDYLMEEVLSAQSPESRQFLAITAVLDRFCPPLCDYVLDSCGLPTNSRHTLEKLYRENVFVFPLGSSGTNWYRYHYLFRELLLDQIGNALPEVDRDDIRRRAGEWFAGNGWIEDALGLLVQAGDLDEAAELILEHLHPVIMSDFSRRTLERWLALFPDGAESGRAPLLVARAYLSAHRFDTSDVGRLLDDVEGGCRDLPGDRQRSWCQRVQHDLEGLRAFERYWEGYPEEALVQATAVRDAGATPDYYYYQMGVLYRSLGLALTGHEGKYEALLQEEISRAEAAGSPLFGLYLVIKSGVALYRARLEEARETALRGLAARSRIAIPAFYESFFHFHLGLAEYERNRLDEAQAHFGHLEALQFESNILSYYHALLGLGYVGWARGDLQMAESYAAKAREWAWERGNPAPFRSGQWFERRLAFEGGRGLRLPARPPTVRDFQLFSPCTPSVTWACMQLEQPSAESWSAALRYIDKADTVSTKYGVSRQAFRFGVLRAEALDRLGDRPAALSVLESVVLRAAPSGSIRPFFDCGGRTRELLGLLPSRVEPQFVESVLAAFEPAKPPPGATAAPGAATPSDTLTRREFHVLELLEERLSNKEIARRLGISPATVKMHTLNLYGKLGAHNRRMAVAVAMERGLLSG